MQKGMRKRIEYSIHSQDGDVNHISWQEVKELLKNPSRDIVLVERVTRWWADDGELVKQEEEVLFQKEVS